MRKKALFCGKLYPWWIVHAIWTTILESSLSSIRDVLLKVNLTQSLQVWFIWKETILFGVAHLLSKSQSPPQEVLLPAPQPQHEPTLISSLAPYQISSPDLSLPTNFSSDLTKLFSRSPPSCPQPPNPLLIRSFQLPKKLSLELKIPWGLIRY